MRVLGILLIVAGFVALLYGGFTYKTRETIIDAGPIQASVDRTHRVPMTPVVGGIALAAGLVLLFTSRRRLV
jgi:hypothetical protein